MGKSVLLPIVSTFNDTGIKKAKGAMDSLAGSIGKAVKGFLAYQTISGTTQFAQDIVTQASDLQRNTAGLTTIFGANSKAMQEWSANASAFGLSASDASKAATFLGSVLKSAGFETAQVSEETKRLTVLAADLAATYGYDIQEALTGMTALFRGEYDPIEKFGVAIKQSQVNTMLAARGMDKLTGAASIHAQQLIRLELLYGATQAAQGAYGRQQGQLFTSMSMLTAEFKNLEAAIGGPMLEPLSKLITQFAVFTNGIKDNAAVFGKGIGDMITALSPLFLSLSQIILAFTQWFGGISSGIALVLTPLVNIIGAIALGFGVLMQWISPIAPAIGAIAAAVVAFELVSMAWIRIKSMIETVQIALLLLKDAFIGVAAAEGAATVGAETFKIALLRTGIGVAVVGLGTLASGLFTNSDAALQAANSMKIYNDVVAAMPTPKLPSSPTGAESATDPSYRRSKKFSYPNAPKPGDTITWYLYQNGLAVWYEQTWDGKHWSKAKRMTVAKTTGTSVSTKVETTAEKRRKTLIAKQKKDYQDLATSIRNSFTNIQQSMLNAFDITQSGSSANRVVTSMKRLVDATKKFRDNIAGLSTAGLNKDLLNQLISAGPMAAGKLAENLLKSGQVGALNTAYGEYGALSSDIARIGTQSVYGTSNMTNYNITVAAGLGNKETIAKAVVEAITYYNKQNGKKI